jgi:hypothetical protein
VEFLATDENQIHTDENAICQRASDFHLWQKYISSRLGVLAVQSLLFPEELANLVRYQSANHWKQSSA